MGVLITGRYLGQKKVELTHSPSGSILVTSAPLDNQGDGKSFSPTDLVAAALASCMLTTMAIVAERDGTDLSGADVSIEKHMHDTPRRIGALPITIRLPARLDPAARQKMENCARACPVHRSLDTQVQVDLRFVYDR